MMPKTMAFVQWEPLVAHYLKIKRQIFPQEISKTIWYNKWVITESNENLVPM